MYWNATMEPDKMWANWWLVGKIPLTLLSSSLTALDRRSDEWEREDIEARSSREGSARPYTAVPACCCWWSSLRWLDWPACAYAERLTRLVCWSLAVSLTYKDHVVFSEEKSSHLTELVRRREWRWIQCVLVGIELLLVFCKRSELSPHREHAVWEAPGCAGAPA